MSDERTLAHQLHDAYESLAPSFGYKTRWETRVWDPDCVNGRLMTAAVDAVVGPLRDRAERAEADLTAMREEVDKWKRAWATAKDDATAEWRLWQARMRKWDTALATLDSSRSPREGTAIGTCDERLHGGHTTPHHSQACPSSTSNQEAEKCECGDDTIDGCATRPSRHCGLWASQEAREGT